MILFLFYSHLLPITKEGGGAPCHKTISSVNPGAWYWEALPKSTMGVCSRSSLYQTLPLSSYSSHIGLNVYVSHTIHIVLSPPNQKFSCFPMLLLTCSSSLTMNQVVNMIADPANFNILDDEVECLYCTRQP